MAYPYVDKKILVILKHSIGTASHCRLVHIVALLECFNIHIELIWAEMPQTVCLEIGVEASMVMQWTVNPPPNGTPGSIPGYSTKFIGI